MNSPRPIVCPNAQELYDYANGRSTDEQAQRIDDHLSSCANCLSNLDQLGPKEAWQLNSQDHHSADAEFMKEVIASIARPSMTAKPGLRIELNDNVPQIPGYRIERVVGRGGMGIVYAAQHLRLNKPVAIKVMQENRKRNPDTVLRFDREIQAVGKLDDPHIVRAMDAGEIDGSSFLVMELIDGIDLARLVKRDGPLPVSEAVKLIKQAAKALSRAHAHGIIHRDVKPSNLMLTSDGQLKLLDLGLARLPDEDNPKAVHSYSTTTLDDSQLTADGQMLGTRDFMAPEQVDRPHEVGPPADVFGLGATLWFLLTGTTPPRHGLPNADLPGRLSRRVWTGLVAKDPRQRFQSMDELLVQLPQERSSKSHTRNMLIATVGVIVVSSLCLVWWNRPGEQKKEDSQQKTSIAQPSVALPKLPFEPGQARALQQEHAKLANVPMELTNSIGQHLWLIPPGEYGISSQTQFVLTKPFYLASTETTVEQFRQFVKETKFLTKAERGEPGGSLVDESQPEGKKFRVGRDLNWKSPGHREHSDRHPITQVDASDVDAFCAWLSRKEKRTYRLPTHAEWIWAARAGRSFDQPFEFGPNSNPLVEGVWYRNTCLHELYPRAVKLQPPNPFGLHDMLGNVYEICADDFCEELPSGRVVNFCHRDEFAEGRLILGGAYLSRTLNFHAKGFLERATCFVGFRVACDIPIQ